MLYSSSAELELISDPEMHEFLQRALRGGVSFIGKRHILGDPDLESGADLWKLLYADFNNLYGSCFKYRLPYDKYRWLTNTGFLYNFGLITIH